MRSIIMMNISRITMESIIMSLNTITLTQTTSIATMTIIATEIITLMTAHIEEMLASPTSYQRSTTTRWCRSLQTSFWCTRILPLTDKESWKIKLSRRRRSLQGSKTQGWDTECMSRRQAKRLRSWWSIRSHWLISANKKTRRNLSSSLLKPDLKIQSTSHSGQKLTKQEGQLTWLNFGKHRKTLMK